MTDLLRPLLRATPGARWRIALAVLLAAAASGSSVALMGVSAWLLSRAAEMPPIMYLNVAVVGVRTFGISRGVFRYTERLVGHDIALRLQSALRIDTYRRLSRTTLLGRRRGDLLSRLVSDVDAILDLVTRVLLPIFSGSLVVLGTTLVLGRFSPANAAVLLMSCVLAGALCPWWAQQASAAADRRTAAARGALSDRVHELERTAVDLVAYDALDARAAALLSADAELREIERRGAWVRGIATAAQILCAGLAVCAAVWIGGSAVADGTLKPRLVAVLALIPLALHEVLGDLVKAAQVWTRSVAALRRVDEVLRTPQVGCGDLTHAAGAVGRAGIDVTDATIGWPGEAPTATHLDLHVGPGERVAVTGPSGVGKTTLAATILGLIPPQTGDVTATGRVGYLAQDAHIFATSVAENVRIGKRDATDAEVDAALTRAGLALPASRVVGEMGASLSGGEQRRLALARLLVGDFDCFILDEPTEHLDAETAARVMADMWEGIGDAPTLVVTHDAGLAATCSRQLSLASRPSRLEE